MKQRNLFITGISSDFGMALTQRIHPQYDYIWGQYRTMSPELETLQRICGEKLRLLRTDFLDAAAIELMLQTIQASDHRPTHILHLSAPTYENQRFHKIPWEAFQKDWEISFRSFVLISQAFLPLMAKAREGKIVVMLSSCVCHLPPKFSAHYVSIKYALLGAMKALAQEYGDKQISVYGISPDMTDTKFLRSFPELILQQHAMASPLGRLLSPQDVVPVIEFLLSDGANYINGQNILISGG